MRVRAYLRASTAEQDATRACEQIEAFAADRGLDIVGWFIENESGAKLQRPELFRLLEDSKPGDVLLVEQVDRLSRLTDADWRKLRATMRRQGRAHRGPRLAPPAGNWRLAMGMTSPRACSPRSQRDAPRYARCRGPQGLRGSAQKATAGDREGETRGALQGPARGYRRGTEGIAGMLKAGMSWSSIQAATGCSRATIAKVSQRAAAPQGSAFN